MGFLGVAVVVVVFIVVAVAVVSVNAYKDILAYWLHH